MRCLLLAFALGVLALQQQAELPSTARVVWIALRWPSRCCPHRGQPTRDGRRRRAMDYGALLSTAVAIGLGGFFHAAWRAEARLADELPRAWEGRDIEIVASSTSCPSPGSAARASRWRRAGADPGGHRPVAGLARLVRSWRDERAGQDVPELRGGERWDLTVRLKRPHGTVNPHGFDVEAWLLENEFRATGYVRETMATGDSQYSWEDRGTTSSACANRSASAFSPCSRAGRTPA